MYQTETFLLLSLFIILPLVFNFVKSYLEVLRKKITFADTVIPAMFGINATILIMFLMNPENKIDPVSSSGNLGLKTFMGLYTEIILIGYALGLITAFIYFKYKNKK